VLFGSSYWKGLLDWFSAQVLPEAKISEHDMDMFHITDSPAEVVEIVTRSQSSLTELDNTVSDEIRLSSI
jgi:predicted Rossmann-fold nucleotide-binding protein